MCFLNLYCSVLNIKNIISELAIVFYLYYYSWNDKKIITNLKLNSPGPVGFCINPDSKIWENRIRLRVPVGEGIMLPRQYLLSGNLSRLSWQIFPGSNGLDTDFDFIFSFSPLCSKSSDDTYLNPLTDRWFYRTIFPYWKWY